MKTSGRNLIAGTACLAASVVVACGEGREPIGPADGTPPAVTILQPAAQAVVNTSRPTFVARVTDAEDRLFPGTINATIDGRDFSQTFLNGFDGGDQIVVSGTVQLEDGAHTLQLRISDRSGNRGSASVTFTVVGSGGGGGGGGT